MDVWAAGIITYIMLCGYPPFRSNNNNQEELFDTILDANLTYPTAHWERVSPAAFGIIRSTLQGDPKARPTARDLLQKPWLASVSACVHVSQLLAVAAAVCFFKSWTIAAMFM